MTTQEQEKMIHFEEDAVFTAQKYLRNLASGRNPLGGEDLAEDHMLRDPSLVKALDLSADLLEAYLKNGGFNTVRPERVRPFRITEAQRQRIELSTEPIGVTTLAANITKVLPYDMRVVRYSDISNWLQYIGALEWDTSTPGSRKRVASAMGKELGIQVVERKSVEGNYYRKNVYTAQAQQFVIDNLESIMSHHMEAAVRKAVEKVEKAKAELEAAQKAMEGEVDPHEEL